MVKTHKIVTAFGDSEVRRKSGDNVPPFLREWESLASRQSLLPPEWNSLVRRINTPGYPPFDIFSHWLMDFATIAAGQLGRNDWQNYRKMLLVHVHRCPLYCWYCFNDAWEENKNVIVDKMQASEIVKGFRTYREAHKNPEGEKINSLRISGGEPFSNSLLVRDIAEEFGRQIDDNEAFLWIDTNLIPFPENPTEDIKKALKAISDLKNRAAVHACIHGTNPDSFFRNTRKKITGAHVKKAIALLLNNNIKVYPRLNPITLTPFEIKEAFELLASINHDLPLKTYLGPIALLYEHTIDRMKAFQGLPPLFAPAIKKLPDPEKTAIPSYNPSNVAIYTWNRLLEQHYGVGYAKIPRHIDAQLKPVSKGLHRTVTAKWHNFVFICKGWEKESCARKMLEVLGVPDGFLFEMELKNQWIEPTFLAHAVTCPDFYTEKGVNVLVAAAQKGSVPNIIPLRWGRIKKIGAPDCRRESSLKIHIEMLNHAHDFKDRFVPGIASSVFEYLASYCGASHLPFSGATSFFGQYMGIELLPEDGSQPGMSTQEGGFKSVVLDIARTDYARAKPDIYYRIKSVKYEKSDTEIFIKGHKLTVNQGETILICIDACNPNLGASGYPDADQAGITVSSIAKSKVEIAPKRIPLSKDGEFIIRVKFDGSKVFAGELLFESANPDARIGSFRLPFEVRRKS